VVLVDEAAEAVAAVDPARLRSFWRLMRVGGTKFKATMRPLAVVVVRVDTEHLFAVATVEDQQPVQTLGADGPDEALRDRIRLRRSHRRLHDPDAFTAENLIERAAVLAVAVADEKTDALLGEVEAEVAGLLGHPGAAGIPRAARKPDAAARVRDEEQRVVAAQEHALDGEEIARDDARRLRVQELAPARPCPPWRRIESRPSEKAAQGQAF
jgi:hypothetical protein